MRQVGVKRIMVHDLAGKEWAKSRQPGHHGGERSETESLEGRVWDPSDHFTNNNSVL